MNIEQRIFDELDQGRICVFPTQVSKRAWLIAYARARGCAVLDSQAISWDKFVALFLPKAKEKPSNALVRTLFALSHKSEIARLPLFSSAEFPESSSEAAYAAARSLGSLKLALLQEDMPLSIRRDCQALLNLYEDFLERHGLFEGSYQDPERRDSLEAYTVVFSNVIRGFDKLSRSQGGLRSIEIEPASSSEEVFDNSLCEIRTALRRIRAALLAGQNDIMLSVCKLDDLRSMLELEALKLDIPLVFAQARSLASYGPGAFFTSIQAMVASDFSYADVEAFLNDPRFVFRDRDRVRKVLRQGSDNSILGGFESWSFKITGENRAWIRTLMLLCRSLVSSRSTEALRKTLSKIADDYLEESGWGVLGEESALVYSTIDKVLTELDQTMKAIGLERLDGLFSVFLRILAERTYLKQEDSVGVRVYDYGASVALPAKLHFILNATAATTRACYNDLDFLSEADYPQVLRTEEDLTDPLLDAYAGLGGRFSCSSQSYSGISVPVLRFEKVKASERLADSFRQELEVFASGAGSRIRPSDYQRRSFEAARLSLPAWLEKKGQDFSFLQAEDWLKVSATSLNRFLNCPFSWYAYKVLDIQDVQYQPVRIDHLKLGNVLHDIAESWAQDQGGLNGSQESMIRISDRELDKYFSGLQRPDELTKAWIAETFGKDLSALVDSAKPDFGPLSLYGTEISRSCIVEGVKLEGRADLVLQRADELYVVDFKKGSVSASGARIEEGRHPESVQMMMYAKLLEDEGRWVYGAAFYSFQKGTFVEAFSGRQAHKLIDAYLKEDLERFKDALAKGRLEPTPSDKACEACIYRPACRRRFNAR